MTVASCDDTLRQGDVVVATPGDGGAQGPETEQHSLSPWAAGVVVVLVASVLQRAIGFVRAAWFCRWLDAEQLGTWDLAFSFLMTATPLVVLALPGCLGRYVGHFQERGMLGPFLRKVAFLQGGLSAFAGVVMVFLAEPIAKLIFGSSGFASYVYLLAAGLVVVAWSNYLYELTTALRLSRWIATLQLINSVLFAVFGIGLLWIGPRSAESVIIAYLVACAITIVCAYFVVRPWLLESHSNVTSQIGHVFWPKVLWYSLGLWATGTVGNLFAVVDRYMIVHFSPLGVNALGQVGDYHAARLVPVLLVSLAGLVATLSLPHLSHSWERNRRERCGEQLLFLVKVSGLLLMVVSTGVLIGRSVIFDTLLAGKYPAAEEILPLTLLTCCWFSLFLLLENYVLCCEKAHWAAIAMVAGLLANVILNICWLPLWGLWGAIAATAVANALALGVLGLVSYRLGLPVRLPLLWIILMPLGLLGGPVVAAILTVTMILLATRTRLLFSPSEKREFVHFWKQLTGLHQALRSFLVGGRWHRQNPPKALPLDTDARTSCLEPAFVGKAGRAWPNPFFRRKRHPPLGDRGPLRVMFVITSMPVGGAERLLVEIIRRLDRRIIQPELCCLKTLGPLGEELAQEVPAFSQLLSHKYDLRVLPRLYLLMRRRHIDAVITVGTGGDKMFWGRLAAFLAGVPVIASALHSTGLPDRVEWLNRLLTPLTDAFIAVAQPHAEYLVAHEGCPRDRTWIIANGVDTDRFSPRPPSPERRRELGLPPGCPVVSIVAALRPEKNHELFLQAAAIIHKAIPEAHFVIVGDGPRREMLEQMATQLGLQEVVHFLGTRHDIPDILACSDVVVLSSHMEANPLAILEAMACGKPVVATRVGSVPTNVVDGLTGFLVPPGDVVVLADRCMLLLNSARLREDMGRAGRRHVLNRASLTHTVKGYEGLIVKLYARKCGSCASTWGNNTHREVY